MLGQLFTKRTNFCQALPIAVLLCLLAALAVPSVGQGWCVFISTRTKTAQIFMMNGDGSVQTRLTYSNANDNRPNISPDGKVIVFDSDRDGTNQIYLMNADGSGQTRLSNNKSSDYDPAISNDKTRIAFVSSRDGHFQIYTMNPDGSQQTNISKNSFTDESPMFTPDGTQIVYVSTRGSSGKQIYIMNVDGSNQQALTKDTGNNNHPAVSPDGKSITFYAIRNLQTQVYIMNIDGSNEQALTTTGGNLYPAFSVDGTKIAFTSNRDGNDEIYLMNIDGTAQTRLTINPADDRDPTLLPGQMPPPPPTIGIPTLTAPLDAATGVALAPQLSWNSVTSATVYAVQVASDNIFTQVVYDNESATLTKDTPSPQLNGSTQYWWRVRAGVGNRWGEWSSTRAFTTQAPPIAAPALIAPEDGATNIPTATTLFWGAVAGAASYGVQVATDAGFTNIFYAQDNITGLSTAIAGMSVNTTYWWRAHSSDGQNLGDWSGAWSFVTIPPVYLAPTLLTPLDNQMDVALNVALTWTKVDNATAYNVQLATDPGFTTGLITQNNVAGVTTSPAGLANGTLYYWRVQAGSDPYWSAWSTAFSFTTTLAAPVLLTPLDKATGIAVAPTLIWQAVTGATTYHLQVARDPDFTIQVQDFPAVSGAFQALSGLLIGMQYYWRVNATNGISLTDWSPVWSFTTTTPTASYQPDLAIHTSEDSVWVGTGVYDTLGNELVGRDVSSGQIAVYPITLCNNGNRTDSFTVTCDVGRVGWQVHCFMDNGLEITTKITGGGWQVVNLDPGKTINFRLEVTPDSNVLLYDELDVKVTALSVTAPTSGDVVEAATSKVLDVRNQ